MKMNIFYYAYTAHLRHTRMCSGQSEGLELELPIAQVVQVCKYTTHRLYDYLSLVHRVRAVITLYSPGILKSSIRI